QQVDKPQKKMLQQEGLLQNKEFQKMLTTDMPKAAHDFIAPLAKKHGLDLTDAAQANKLASMFVSNSTAQEALGAALYRSAEIQRQLDRAEARDPEQCRKDTAGNLRSTMTGLDNAIQGVGGQTIQALAPVVTPQVQALTGAISSVSALTKEGKYGEAAIKVGEGLNAIAPLVAGGAVMKPLITQAMSAMAPIMAMRAIASGDPATQALGSAAGALTGAAGDLSAAAGVMTGKGALPGAELPGMGLRSPVGA